MAQTAEKITVSPASPWKRLFAWIYDWLPAAGVFVLVFAIGLGLVNLVWSAPANEISASIGSHPLWITYLVLSTSIYYLYCWTKGGQTVGMRTWRIQLLKADGRKLTYAESIIRALLSFGGIANIWAFIDSEHRGWHDIAVDAYLVQLPKLPKNKEQQKPLI
ncbi:RDD family protein [Pleionea sediminis]|uniref:RDD family protein n=1 Tax=Pleionea sediminis TaxID=2569479 RepID=UPI0011848B5E|nr:RDD family protein [Pleionea sediminis]